MSKIEWTGETWNPIAGCSVVSPGCTNCYAMTMAARLAAMAGDGLDDNGYAVRGTGPLDHYRGLTKRSKAGPVWTGKVALAPDSTLLKPTKRQKPTTYFVNSMSDLFHEDVPDEWILRVLDVIRSTGHDGGSNCGRIRDDRGREGQHVYQVLTKRSWRMLDFMSRLAWDGERLHLRPTYDRARVILRNLWLGVSAEDQRRADERIPDLLRTPAAVRFVSAEPLLGPIDFTTITHPHAIGGTMRTNAMSGRIRDLGDREPAQQGGARLSWCIVGGESGNGARPMNREWADNIVGQCKSAGVSVFVKQLGACYVDEKNGVAGAGLKVSSDVRIASRLRNRKGGDMSEWPTELCIREMPQGALA